MKTDCRLKWTESEMAARALTADKYHARFAEARYPTQLRIARDPKTTQAQRENIYEKVKDARSKVENKFGVRGLPVFEKLGYFKCVPQPHSQDVQLHALFLSLFPQPAMNPVHTVPQSIPNRLSPTVAPHAIDAFPRYSDSHTVAAPKEAHTLAYCLIQSPVGELSPTTPTHPTPPPS